MTRIGAALAVVMGAYMLGDGIHRLASGTYFGSGVRPWAAIVRMAGIDPLSPAMAAIFIAFGIAWCAAAPLFVRRSGYRFLAVLAVATLWYAPVGTAMAIAEFVIALRVVRARR
ncbi:MAG: hypothetical protein ABR591_06250 [Candidatus Velthaea sp.]